MKLKKYTESQLRNAVNSSRSVRQTLTKLNIASYGGNYDVFHKAVDFFKIDTSHFTGKGWSKGTCNGRNSPIEDYLSNLKPISSHKLRLKLLKEKIFEPLCSSCKTETWLEHPIPLELDHINGNNKDNCLENLRLLCPNCHALTPTYRGKNKASKV